MGYLQELNKLDRSDCRWSQRLAPDWAGYLLVVVSVLYTLLWILWG